MARTTDPGFARTPSGVIIHSGRAELGLTFADISRLNRFLASGDTASTGDLRRKYRYMHSPVRFPTAELLAELRHREALNETAETE